MSYLIQDMTREERERIIAESLGNIKAGCDGCMAGLAEMYQAYIDGEKELREINPGMSDVKIKGRIIRAITTAKMLYNEIYGI